jgi:hypothetical protein
VVRDADTAVAHLAALGEAAVPIGRIVATTGDVEARIAIPEGWLA